MISTDKKIRLETNGDYTDNYKLLIGSILPRPIAFVSTRNHDGSHNLAPFSFFTGISAKPMIVGFCPSIRTSTGEEKDTLKNIRANKEFVINFVTQEYAGKANYASADLPYGEDEFAYAGLTPIAGEKIQVARVQESPIQFECVLRDILSYGDTPGAGTLVAGEVVLVHVDEKVYDKGRILTDIFNPIGRGAGSDWVLTDHRIQLERNSKK